MYTQHDTKCTYIQNVARWSFFRTFDLIKYIKSPSNVYTLNLSRKSLLNCVFCNNYHETKLHLFSHCTFSFLLWCEIQKMYQWKYSAQDLSHSLNIFLASLIDYYEEDDLGYLYIWPNHFTFKLGFMIWMYAD